MSAVESLRYFWPELILAGFVLLAVLGDLVLRGHPAQRRRILTLLSAAGVLAAGAAVLALAGRAPVLVFFGMAAVDGLAVFIKLLAATAVLCVILYAYRSSEIATSVYGELQAFLLAMLLGMFLLASATNLLMIYLALEFVSIASYLLTGLKRASRPASEAALKYVIYGAFASGIMLFGMSYLYGLCGSLDLGELRSGLAQRLAGAAGGEATLIRATLATAVIFVLGGFTYKIAAAPFHMWCPDVYEGAATPVTALLSVAPKAAGFAVLVRFFLSTFTGLSAPFVPTIDLPWPWILGIISAVTMTIGNLSALHQTNLKRLLAYSSIAHAGYILMGVVAASGEGLFAVLFYLAVYLFMNLGAFLAILAVREKTGSESLEAYRGLGRRDPLLAVLFAICLFSLAGLPPLAGFIGKFYLFAALLKNAGSGYYLLAVIGILNSVVALYYYARIIKAMFLEPGEAGVAPLGILALHKVLLLVLVVPTLLFGVYWEPLVRGVRSSLTIEGSVPHVVAIERTHSTLHAER